jgi:hypothetical protein
VLDHFQEQGEDYALSIKEEHVEDLRGSMDWAVVDEDGLYD